MLRLLRPTRIGRFRRSFPSQSVNYAPETIAETVTTGVALATAIIGRPGSSQAHQQ